MNKLKLTLISLILLLVAMFGYYQYAIEKIPERIAQSQNTIINVDSLRFTFKVSLLAQKSLTAYLEAIKNQDQERLYDAIDYLDASMAFSDIGYIKDAPFSQSSLTRLRTISSIIQNQQLNPTQADLKTIIDNIKNVSYMAEEQERATWHVIQKNYIEFSTQQYKLKQLYETLTLASILFLMVTGWLALKQRKLLKINKEHQVQLKTLAYFDPLTEIANRKRIENSVESMVKQANRHRSSFYIALIDLDDFKKINDILGHDAGDQLLRMCATNFSDLIREEDEIGRLGGDEFLILFNENTTELGMLAILKRIQQVFNQPTVINGSEFHVTTSIGLAQYPNDVKIHSGSAAQNLIKSADIAMYHAKKLGKSQFHFFNEALEQQIRLEHQMDKEIKQAIEQNQFELFYQPQIDTQTLEVIGAEALVRWNHPKRGLIMPNDFIIFIEKGYHTTLFGEWVIQKALLQQQKWKQQGMDLDVSINLSVKHILSHNFHDKMIEIIRQNGANLKKVAFEITEYELISSETDAINDLKKLEAQGFKFHLDDFGTGYSSISYLSQLPIDTIKIDKSFIDYIQPNETKKNLVSAIIELGNTLNKIMVAEGVETQYQVDYLKESGCQILQGYLFSKPLSVEHFESYYYAYQEAKKRSH